jgi:succinate dehydrogenase / fumarate reductase cytochrome b subunit
MSSRLRLFDTSVGTKLLIGVTGLFLVLYLIIHIVGNAMFLFGPGVFNAYADMLGGNPLIPAIEVVLLVVFLVHIYKTVRMFLGNQAARPVGYVEKRRAGPPSRKTLASTTMIVTGLWLVIFLVIHVKTFRFSAHPETPEGIVDLYHVETEALASPLALAFYAISMLIVGSHLWHGASSAFQSVGLDHPRWTPRLIVLGKVFAFLIAGGFIAIAIVAHFAGAQR